MKKLVLLMTLAMVGAQVPVCAETYKISIMPRFFNEKLKEMMTPLVDYLRGQTGIDIELALANDNADYEKQLNGGAVAIGFQNPIVYVDVTPQHEVVAAARELGEDRFRGIVIVRPESSVKELNDLRGKHVMITGKTSAGGYLSQKLSLMQAGISLAELKLETAADNRQENVVIAVSVGDVEAGFVRESSFHVADKYIVPGSIKKATETEWVPAWAFSVDRKLPNDIKAKIADAVLKLPPGSPILKALEIDQFVPAKDADYDSIRRALTSDR